MTLAPTQVALPPRYKVVRHIANGGMAAVFVAEDALLERLVAVKVLAAGYAADPIARRRFTREARAAARVSDHPHVVTVYDIGESTDARPQAFIVMEHFAGGTVADRLRRDVPVPVPTALRWLREAASALDTAHAADIVHRDVKPGNLLLDERGRLAVGDFGIASLAGETQVTQAGQVLGTAAYLSPEQARGLPATPASDRYSLAVVAFELLCGHRPFGGDTPMAQARAHLEIEPPSPTGPCEAASDVLRHGLAKDPRQRPLTAAAFVEELVAVLGDDEDRRREPATAPMAPIRRVDGPQWRERERFARAPAPPPPVPPPEPVARARSPHRRAWTLATVALLCVGGGGAAALITDNGTSGGSTGAATAPRASRSEAQAPEPTRTTASRATPKAAPPATAPGATTPATTATTPATTPAPTAGASPAALNDAGFAKLPADPAGALPLLEQARQGFQAQGDHGSINYAFNLYNLAWALRLSGRPAEAIPLLQERLRISDYKRDVVEKELATARAAAGGTGLRRRPLRQR